MGSIMNGLAAHGGSVPFGATFLVFSDYMRPPIRLAALMRSARDLRVYPRQHCLGEDGATHQPVEQLASLRAIPDLIVIRPGDANETAVAWRVALETRERPVALVLTRQDVPTLDRTQLCRCRWPATRRIHAGRRAGWRARSDPDRQRLRSRADRAGAAEIAGRRISGCASSRCRAGNCSKPSRGNTATRCCRRRSAPGSRSKPGCRRVGIATSAAAAMCWRGSLRRVGARRGRDARVRLHRRKRMRTGHCPSTSMHCTTRNGPKCAGGQMHDSLMGVASYASKETDGKREFVVHELRYRRCQHDKA